MDIFTNNEYKTNTRPSVLSAAFLHNITYSYLLLIRMYRFYTKSILNVYNDDHPRGRPK